MAHVASLSVEITADPRNLESGLASANKRFTSFGQDLTRLGAGLSVAVTAPLVLMGKAALDAGSSFESAFAGVRKTLSATEPELAAIREGFRKMALEIPVTANELARIGEAAGALGVKTADVMGFTKVMANLGVATNLTSDQAATGLARLANIIKNEAGPQYDRLGATLVALGNAGASTESEILEMSLRIAGAGKQAGLSEADILGFANALSSVGIEAEAGGSSISRVFIKMADATKLGGKELQVFAQTAGVSAAEFKRAFEQDAAGAAIKFIEGLGNIAAAGQSLTPVLTELELSDIRVSDALRRAAGSGDLFRQSVELGSKAWAENTALTKEAAERYKTFESQVQLLKNQLTDIAITIFDKLRPSLIGIVDTVKSAVSVFEDMDAKTIKMGVALLALAAAAGPVLVAIGAIITAIGTIGVPVLAATAAVGGLATAYITNFGGIRDSANALFKDLASFYADHKTEIDGLAQAVAVALGIIVKLWAENAATILDSLRVITLGMRLAMGDWGAAWTQYKEMAKKEQEASKKNADEWFNYLLSKSLAFANGFFAHLLKIHDATVNTWAKIKDGAAAAWNAIADAVVGPIKRAYDFLKGLNWRQIFSDMTAAAKAGLQVHSPPIIAVWVSQIGDAALKAAAATQRSVPTFSDSYKSITSSAKAHLPVVAQEWLKVGEAVLDVIAKIKKVTTGDIFGGSGSGGTSQSDKGFLGALGRLAEGVGGVASVFGGVDSIIKSIRSIFGIKSAFQKAMEAEQLAQARLQTQQSQQQVLQLIEQTKQSWIDTLDKGRALLESIAFYSKVPKLAFNQFFQDMHKLFKGMVELAKKWKLDATQDIKLAAENLSAGVSLLSQLPAALDGISKYLGTPDASFAVFFAAAAKYFDKLEEFLDTIPKSTAKAIGKFSNWLKSGVDLLAPLTEGLKGLFDLKELPTDAQFGLVNLAVEEIITNIGLLGQKFEKGMLKQMAFFSEKAGSALALWKDTIDAIKATVGIQPLSETDADNLVSGLTMFIDRLTIGLGKLNTEELTRVSAIAQTILPIAGALKAWADTSAAVRGYTVIAAESWEAIVTDFGKAITLMGVLIGQAQLFESMAITLEGHLKSGAQHLADGISAMATGVLNTATALQSAFGHIQGGTMGTTSVGGFGAMSLQAAGGGGVSVGSIIINGTNLSPAQLQDAVVGALVKAEKRGRF